MILDLIALENTSKVWLYQADRELSYDELDEVRESLFHFLNKWTAHNQELRCYANIFHRRFLGLFVDESFTKASGCSIDSSVRYIQNLGKQLNVNFFDRMTHAYMIDEEIYTIDHHDMTSAYKSGDITDETLFFDNNVKTKGEFLKHWLVPLNKSWHKRFV